MAARRYNLADSRERPRLDLPTMGPIADAIPRSTEEGKGNPMIRWVMAVLRRRAADEAREVQRTLTLPTEADQAFQEQLHAIATLLELERPDEALKIAKQDPWTRAAAMGRVPPA